MIRMETALLVNEIMDAFSDLGNAERREKLKTYALTVQKVLGVTSPDIKQVIKETLPALFMFVKKWRMTTTT